MEFGEQRIYIVVVDFDRRSAYDHGIWRYCEMILFKRHPNSMEMITLFKSNNI